MPANSPTCGLCCDAPSKYKCPVCLIPYCSLSCYKPHKETCKTVATSTPPPEEKRVTQKTTGKAEQEARFARLLEDERVLEMLKDADIREKLKRIAQEKDDDKAKKWVGYRRDDNEKFAAFVGTIVRMLEPDDEHVQ